MDWRFNTIWYEQIEKDKIFIKDFRDNKNKKECFNFENSEYGIIWGLKQKINSFDNLNESEKMLHLELYYANIKDFSGIGKFKNLKRLELFNCLKLENDNEIDKVSDTIEFLHINQSKKFKFTESLLKLKKLKVLCLNSCDSIENLDFLNKFPNLIDFRFVDTNILDGNLNQILEHPTIRTVGFMNKRHYNFKYENLKIELEKKNKTDYKAEVYNGEYSTFRYEYE